MTPETLKIKELEERVNELENKFEKLRKKVMLNTLYGLSSFGLSEYSDTEKEINKNETKDS